MVNKNQLHLDNMTEKKYSPKAYVLSALKQLTLATYDEQIYFSPMVVDKEVTKIFSEYMQLWQTHVLEALLSQDIHTGIVQIAKIVQDREQGRGTRVGFRANLEKLARYEKNNSLPEPSLT